MAGLSSGSPSGRAGEEKQSRNPIGPRGAARSWGRVADWGDRLLVLAVEGVLAFIPAVVVAFVVGSRLDYGFSEVHYGLFGIAVAVAVPLLRAAAERSATRR